MFKSIDMLITKHGFALESWDDRYGKGVWVALSPSEHLTGEIMSSSSAGDCDMIPATEFVLGSEWMPVVTGGSFLQTMTLLEGRLAKLPPEMLDQKSAWTGAVSDALQHLRDVQRDNGGYGTCYGKFVPLPETFAQLLASSTAMA